MRDRKVQPRHKAGRRSGSIQSLFLDIAQGLCAIAYAVTAYPASFNMLDMAKTVVRSSSATRRFRLQKLPFEYSAIVPPHPSSGSSGCA